METLETRLGLEKITRKFLFPLIFISFITFTLNYVIEGRFLHYFSLSIILFVTYIYSILSIVHLLKTKKKNKIFQVGVTSIFYVICITLFLLLIGVYGIIENQLFLGYLFQFKVPYWISLSANIIILSSGFQFLIFLVLYFLLKRRYYNNRTK